MIGKDYLRFIKTPKYEQDFKDDKILQNFRYTNVESFTEET